MLEYDDHTVNTRKFSLLWYSTQENFNLHDLHIAICPAMAHNIADLHSAFRARSRSKLRHLNAVHADHIRPKCYSYPLWIHRRCILYENTYGFLVLQFQYKRFTDSEIRFSLWSAKYSQYVTVPIRSSETFEVLFHSLLGQTGISH